MKQTTSTVVATARTWLGNAIGMIRLDSEKAQSEDARWLVTYQASRFMRRTLSNLEELLPLLDYDNYDEWEDEYEDIEKALADLSKWFKNQRLAAQLSNTEGRSPEEAALFEAKATELRRSLDGAS